MSFKQDRTGARTPADLERKYAFGQTFAEVYQLAEDAKKAAENASNAFDSLTSEEIYNRLTNYGKLQGVFRDTSDHIYINASYVNFGKLTGADLEVDAATIKGTLSASKVDASELKVNAANITGSLAAGSVSTFMANVTGEFIASKITTGALDAKILNVDAAKITGLLSADNIDTENLYVDAANVWGSLSAGDVYIDGELTILDYWEDAVGSIGYVTGSNQYGTTRGIGMYNDEDGVHMVVATNGGAKLASDTSEVICADSITLKSKKSIYAGDSVIGDSDRRLKENILYNVDDYLAVFDALRPATFSWKEKANKDKHFGFIAQDVEEVRDGARIPAEDFALLNIREDGTYGLAYTEFIPLIVAKVQHLDAEVKELRQIG